MKSFFGELKKRRVYRVALAYIIAGSAIVQLAGSVFPIFHAPEWAQQSFVVLIAFGFPIALVLAWSFDIEGGTITKTPGSGPVQVSSRRMWLLGGVGWLIAALALAGYWVWHPWKSHTTPEGLQPASEVADKSIGVLPFENLSDEKENAFFTDGVADEILTNLAKIADLKVISRTSVQQYKTGLRRNLRDIAQQLGVANILEGSVQRANGRVRVTAQLIDARTDSHIWAERYDRPLTDVFAIQSEIAQTIADQLKAKLSSTEKEAIAQKPTADLAAYDLYVRANILRANTSFDLQVKENLREAARLLEQAIARDPNFFLAYYRLAGVQDLIYFLGTNEHTPAQLARAEAAIKNALRLRPDSGEAHLALGEHLYRAYRDYDRAMVELKRAHEQLPNEPLALELLSFIERRRGQWDESIAHMRRAFELDPRNLFVLQQLSITYQTQRRSRDVIAVLDRALAIAPTDANTRIVRALVDFEARADTKPLHTTIESLLAENPAGAKHFADQWLNLALCERDPAMATRALAAIPSDGITVGSTWFPRAWCEALVARARGDADAARSALHEARAELEQTLRGQPDYAQGLSVLAMIDAALGRKEDALKEGRRAVELLPVSKDVLDGTDMLTNLAMVYSWTGEKDLAFQQLDVLARLPGRLNYGQLRLHPEWDPLHGDPRLEKILALLTPR
ncbi:MAG: tetratricopeptide repeat protein [Chthoniobacterales bacterium]